MTREQKIDDCVRMAISRIHRRHFEYDMTFGLTRYWEEPLAWIRARWRARYA